MRRLLKGHDTAEDYQSSLRIIEQFDALVASGASVHALVSLASQLTGFDVGVVDDLGGACVLSSAPGRDEAATAEGDSVLRAFLAQTGHGQQIEEVTVGGGSVLVTSIEHGGGRLGIAWLAVGSQPWDVMDELALERLAQAVAIRSVRDLAELEPAGATAPLFRLLTDDLGPDTVDLVTAQAGLDHARRYVVATMREQPVGVASFDALLATTRREFHRSDVFALGVTVGTAPAIVTAASETSCVEILHTVAARCAAKGWGLDFGVSRPVHPSQLNAALQQAREALVFGGRAETDDHVTTFAELGVFHLLTRVPANDLAADRDIAAVSALEESESGVSDLTLLEVYCETASLRRTAQRLHLHHSSVDYRLKRIEQTLGFPLNGQFGRLRALLAARLVRMQRIREARR